MESLNVLLCCVYAVNELFPLPPPIERRIIGKLCRKLGNIWTSGFKAFNAQSDGSGANAELDARLR